MPVERRFCLPGCSWSKPALSGVSVHNACTKSQRPRAAWTRRFAVHPPRLVANALRPRDQRVTWPTHPSKRVEPRTEVRMTEVQVARSGKDTEPPLGKDAAAESTIAPMEDARRPSSVNPRSPGQPPALRRTLEACDRTRERLRVAVQIVESVEICQPYRQARTSFRDQSYRRRDLPF